MYSITTDDGSDLRSAGATLMALVMVVSMVAIGGIAMQPVAADHTGEFPDGIDDLDSDEFLVDDDFEDGEIDDFDQAFEEIGAAVDDADAGYTVYVAEGEYTENAVVDTQVDIIGEDQGDDQFDGVQLEADDPAQPALDIQADFITVTHMTFIGGDDAAVSLSGSSGTDNVKDLDFEHNIVVADDGGTGLDAVPMSQGEPDDGNNIVDNTFTVTPDADAEALAFIAGGAVSEGDEQPDGYTVADNTFTTETPVGFDDGTTDISLHLESDDATVENNEFPSEGAGEGAPYDVAVAGDDNEVLSNDLSSAGFTDGLFLVGDGVLATDNAVDGANANGVLVGGDSADVTVDDNEITNSGAWGVDAAAVDDLDVTDNDLDDNLGGVIVDDSSAVDVADNDILDSGLEGVDVSGSTDVMIDGNLVDAEDDDGAGISVASSDDVVVSENDVFYNDDGGISLDDIGVVDNDAAADVADNEISSSGGGISLDDITGGAAVTANHVEENAADGLTVMTVIGDLDVTDNEVLMNAGDGVTIENVAEGDTMVEMNTVEDNDATLQDNHGISVEAVADLFIEDNEVTNNDDDGILVSDAADVDLVDNHVESHDDDGIDVADIGDVDLMDNHVEDHGNDGVSVTDAHDVIVEANHVESQGDDGLTVDDAADVIVEANHVEDTGAQSVGVSDVDTAMVMSNDVADGGDGVAVSDAAMDASVTDNEVEDVDTGIAVDAAGTDEPVDVERNELDMYDTGIHFEAFDAEQPPFAVYNDLLDEEAVDVANDGPETVEALLNYYDTDTGVSHSDIDENAAFEGDVLYDPFLTVPQSDVSVQEPDATQEFGHELTLEATADATDPQVIAFPAPVQGTVDEVFSDVGGAVHAYDASTGNWSSGSDLDGEPIASLDAFVVTDIDEDATIAFEYAVDGATTPGEKTLENGWNLVGAPKKTDVSVAYSSLLDGGNAQVNHFYGSPADQPRFVDDGTAERNGEPLWYESDDDAAGTPAPFTDLDAEDGDEVVSPFTGYWLNVDADDEQASIGGALPKAGTTADDEVDLLETHRPVDEIQTEN